VAFVCYPHAQAHPVVAELLDSGVKVVDLSADFRLRDPADYLAWYGFEHPRVDLVSEAVYGLTELYRDEVARARLVANPGCFPTGALLAAAPLMQKLPLDLVVIDAKSGVSGAGRSPSDKTHFCSVHDNFRAYGEVGHRHTAEIAQELELMAGGAVRLSFTPHLLPVDRGILSTVYLQPAGGAELPAEDERYRDETFVEVTAATPSLREVQQTNFCRLAVRVDRAAGLIKVVVAIDNLMKGASGQAVQNMNLMFGLPESLGLEARV
jgi:N-acetyl-gamma-glutamyl-phosphate reductase